jgi:hypothetical protein
MVVARFFVVFFVALLAACEQNASDPTRDDFLQIKAGLSMDDVHTLPGKPDKVDKASVGKLRSASETWPGRDQRLVVQYFNNEVKFTRLEPLQDTAPAAGTAG